MAKGVAAIGGALLACLAGGAAAEEAVWRGLALAPERRCAPYVSEHYHYPQSVELTVIERQGGIWGPYSGRCFETRYETDIEHIVARSEAHDSGLCARSRAERERFARDPDNLTLAAPWINRRQKRGHDAADWLPEHNRCWFAARVVEVRRKWRLSIDRREAAALERVLSACPSVALQPPACLAVTRRRWRGAGRCVRSAP